MRDRGTEQLEKWPQAAPTLGRQTGQGAAEEAEGKECLRMKPAEKEKETRMRQSELP